MIDPNVLNSDHVPSRSTTLDLALQIGLVGFLIYACSRYISPFSDLLIWSAILSGDAVSAASPLGRPAR
jgi:hypothetical protein